MLIMDGAAGLPLILHEAGHNFTYGILANNEWRSGWMDEGLTSYQTSWEQGQTPQALELLGPPPPPRLGDGYRAYATTMTNADDAGLNLVRLDLLGHSQPIGTPGYAFRDFGTYNAMIYNRGSLLYSQLRDVLGDSAFRAFFHDYYDRWALKHVDEHAMQASAERASGLKLDWFFDQWVHHVGLVDYALTAATTSRTSDGRWLTLATVERRGAYRHPMPVGVRTASGWTIGRGDYAKDVQVVQVITSEQPQEVRLDPWHTTYDWDRRNDVVGSNLFGLSGAQPVFDWPFVNQANRDHSLVAVSPLVWYSDPGALTVGMRARTSYLGLVDRYDFGLAVTSASRSEPGILVPRAISRVQGWWRFGNPYMPGEPAPTMGLSGGAAMLDGVAKVDLSRSWDLSRLWTATGPRIEARLGAVGAYPYDRGMLPAGWENRGLTEGNGSLSMRMPGGLLSDSGSFSVRGSAAVGLSRAPDEPALYGRAELEGASVSVFAHGAETVSLRVYGAMSDGAPAQAALHLSAMEPLSTFDDNWYRPRGSILTRPGVNYLPLGGAGLRGYDAAITVRRIAAGNGEWSQRLASNVFSGLSLWGAVFGGAGFASSDTYTLSGAFLADAGAGLALRGKLYDRDVTMRLDAPFVVQQSALAGGRGLTHGNATVAARWTFSFNDIW
ncbi:MAG TPA: M1 family aminopeptidase [Gemmatimonadaceae bacterium]